MKATLVALLESWRQNRQPEIADLAEAVIAALLATDPRPAIGAGKKAADRTTWRAIASQQDPLDFPRLMLSARGGSQVEVKLQVQYLSGWNHPLLGRGLLELLESPPYAGIKSRPMLEEIFEALENTRDVRLVKPARSLAKRYLSIVNSSTGGWIVSELERIAKVLAAFSPPAMSADERLHHENIVHSLPPDYRPKPQTAELSESVLEALLTAVYEHPENDGKRLIFAQAIREVDRDRSAFIELQIGAARGTNTPDQSARLRTLTTPARLAGWAQPLSMSGECEFARGFPVAIRIYKTALKSLGEKAWTTIEKIDGISALSQKATIELLDHPYLANIKSVTSISSKLLAALDNRIRIWTTLTLDEDPTLDAQLLQRVPKVRELTLRLRGNRATLDPRLLWQLPHLQKLELRIGRECKGVALCVPPTVIEALVDGDVAPGVFAFANKLEKLMFWSSRLEKAQLEGLTGLKSLNTRADHCDADAFEAIPRLTDLKISIPRSNVVLPQGIFRPLRQLKTLDLMYARVEMGALESLQTLEELHNHWLNVDTVPNLPHLTTFHCMLPGTVAEIELFLERNPTVRQLGFCWNSSSELWFSSDLTPQCLRAWEQFDEVLTRSSIHSWSIDNKLKMIRQDKSWRIEMQEKLNHYDWGLPRLVMQIKNIFGISPEPVSPP